MTHPTIITIIPAPADLWLMQRDKGPADIAGWGYGTLRRHERVAYLVLEEDRDLDGESTNQTIQK